MPPKTPNDNRPQIWAEGRQTPRFDVRAFARASLLFGRSDMAGLLQRCAASAQGASASVATGQWRVPEARLGRTGRFLPSYQTVAGTVAGASGLLLRASETLVTRAVVPASSRSLFEIVPGSSVSMPSRRAMDQGRNNTGALALLASDGDDPDLAAIRALMSAAAPEPAASPVSRPRQAAATPEAMPASAGGWLRGPLAGITGKALAYGLLAMALPYGAVKAGLAHLNGEDLRKLES